MRVLAAGIGYFDLHFLGVPRVIATAVVHGAGGVLLIDPGPSTTLPALRDGLATAGMAPTDVTAVLLTHIHLDHGGGVGTLLRENPSLRVYVHEKGAPHLVNPERLVASAGRLYGGAMDRLWGEIRPVPAEAIVPLRGGERLELGGRTLEVRHTPGHASHHVSVFARDAGIAFVGDTAGIRIPPQDVVLPATPPPDVDLEAWRDSLAAIDAWQPHTLFLTHFGPSPDPSAHLRELSARIEQAGRLVRESLARDEPDAAREAWFTAAIRGELGRRIGDADAGVYELADRFDLNWLGLARYFRKTQAVGGA
ncbi:MAG: MBL fold metallo-hydrolase [Acidobacteria bacterium]|nr:MBL fold metallo-hydrolase [Acidobacteriota bacterium]